MPDITYEYKYYVPGSYTGNSTVNDYLNDYGKQGFKIIAIKTIKDSPTFILMKTNFPPNTPIELQIQHNERRLDPEL
jgi:hypothetical protein